MESKLRVKIPSKDKDAGEEPVSPTGQYLNSKAMSLCIISVLESEIPIDDSCATDLLQTLFLPINPRFSSVMVSDRKGNKHWKRVKVNLQDHIKVPKFPDGLSVQEYDDYFEEYLSKIAMDTLPQDRPLWEVHITKYPTSKAAGHLIFKLHHALGDGYSLMGALLSCLQRADNPSLPLTFPSLKSSSKLLNSRKMGILSCVKRSLSPIYDTISDFVWGILKSSLMEDDKTPVRSGNDNVEFKPVKIATIALSLDHIAMIKTKLGVTVNDVIAGTIFLGTRLYMEESGQGFGSSQCTALVVLNTRNLSGYKSVQEMLQPDKTIWGNQFAFLHVGLPELVNDKSLNPLDFISHAHKTIKRRSSLAVYLTARTLDVVRKLRGSEAAAQFIHRTFKNASMTITNMIGPVEKMTLANHPCKGLYFSVTGAPQSLGITILSYMRTVRISMLIEEGHIDSQKFKSSIENAFEMIYKAAHENMS